MSGTDTPETETDLAAAAFATSDDSQPADARGCSAGEADTERAWKACCRRCGELVPAKPYCYECGAERPTDGDYYVESQ